MHQHSFLFLQRIYNILKPQMIIDDIHLHTLPIPSKRFDFHHFLENPTVALCWPPQPTKPNPENFWSSTSSMKEFFTTTWMQRPDPLCSSPNSFCHLRKRTVAEKKKYKVPGFYWKCAFPYIHTFGYAKKTSNLFVASPVKRQLSGHRTLKCRVLDLQRPPPPARWPRHFPNILIWIVKSSPSVVG